MPNHQNNEKAAPVADFLKLLRRKTDMLGRQFDVCASTYDDPIIFCSEAEALLQSVRAYTLIIQKHKDLIPSFSDWYTPWQDALKSDNIMRWAHLTRNGIAHEGFLAVNSNIDLIINDDHRHGILARKFDIMVSTHDVIERAMKMADEQPLLKHATGLIKRYYLCSIDGEDRPILEVLFYACNFMMDIYSDLLSHMSGLSPAEPNRFRSQALPTELQNLETTFKLRDGTRISLSTTVIHRPDDSVLEKIQKRYGATINSTPDQPHSDPVQPLQDLARRYMEAAKQMLKVDGSLLPTVLLHETKPASFIGFAAIFRDRAEKVLFWRKMADEVVRNSADAIISVYECWVYTDMDKYAQCVQSGQDPSEVDEKSEAIGVDLICKDGTGLKLLTRFSRNKDNKIELEATVEEPPETLLHGIYSPIWDKWGTFKNTTQDNYQDESYKLDDILHE